MKRFLLNTFFLLAVAVATAGEKRIEHRLVIDIPFRLAGSSVNEIRYDIDSVALATSLHNLDMLNSDTTAVIKSIQFYSSVSPEGNYAINDALCNYRIKTAEKIVRERLQFSDSVKVSYKKQFIPWQEFLAPAIEADKTIPYREELLKLINNKDRKSRRAKLMSAHNGKLWDILEERYFDHMRKGGAIILVERDLPGAIAIFIPSALNSVEAVDAAAMSFPEEPATETVPQEEPAKCAISLKTNLIGLGMAIGNLTAEFNFAQHWSVSLPVYYSALNYFKPTVKFRTLAAQPEFRYYLKENYLGLFAGAHFGVGYYNIAVDGNIRYQDHAGKCPAYGGGLTLGYRVPMSKKHPNWNIEFLVGAGVYKLKYDTFYNVENGRLIDTYNKIYWGLDNAAINISYKFDLKKRKK